MIYYQLSLVISFFVSVIFMIRRDKYTDTSLTVIFCLVPVSNLGYYLLANTSNINGAIVANKIIYLGGCFMHMLTFLFILSMCRVKNSRGISMIAFLCSATVYSLVVSDEIHHMFYKRLLLSQRHGVAFLKKEYGPFHKYFYLMLVVYLLLDIFVIIYARRRKKDVSIKGLTLLISMVSVNLLAFFYGRLMLQEIDLMPGTFIIDQILLIVIESRSVLYNVEDVVSGVLLQRREIGYIAFDRKLNYLGSDDMMKVWFPDIERLSIDKRPDENNELYCEVKALAKRIDDENREIEFIFPYGGKFFKVKGSYLIVGKRKNGYSIFVEDDTSEQLRINQAIFEKEHDAMTGLYNKRKYIELCGEEYQSLDSIFIMNMDVNNLKLTNDTRGHKAGDALIMRASESLKGILTDNVKGFRLGGDEFMVVGENLTYDEAENLENAWKESVERINENSDGDRVTIACGSAYGRKGYDLSWLSKEADELMYKDKERLKSQQ